MPSHILLLFTLLLLFIYFLNSHILKDGPQLLYGEEAEGVCMQVETGTLVFRLYIVAK